MPERLPVIAERPSFIDARNERDLPWSPRNPRLHIFDGGSGPNVLIVDGSRIYGLDQRRHAALEAAIRSGASHKVDHELALLGLDSRCYVDDSVPRSPPVRTLSLAVAQKCNLGCTYCYAQEGSFGGEAKSMPASVADAAVDRLFAEAKAGDRVTLTFLGGEPLFARDVLRRSTERAEQIGTERGVHVNFSITTNGTLITPEDGEFFERHGFSVSISIDGIGGAHDQLRMYKGGKPTFERIIARVRPLLALQRRMQVSARVTVTPKNLTLLETLRELVAMGFHSVGFSPMLSSPSGREEMGSRELDLMLEQMIDCGREFERKVSARERFPFANLVNALRELHRGTHRPYPCGAGAGYLGVSADGELAACHRFVGDASGALGSLANGLDREQQAKWLTDRHVHRQEPCRSCWARYLCGGGCHHEVIHRGRPACDYIRGWLHYCLQAYVRLLEQNPAFFTDAS